MLYSVYLNEISKGINENHILFKGYIARINPNKKFQFDFIGSDIETKAPITDFAKNNLVECLASDFGYAPFDFNDVKKTFGNGKDYKIELWEN